MKKAKRAVSILAAAAMMATAALGMTGCGESEQGTAGADNKLTWYTFMWDANAYENSNYGDAPAFQKISEETGTEVEFIHPIGGGESEQFNVMLASGDYPDMILWRWNWVNGGLQKMYNDNVVIKLNDLIAQNAPNFQNLLNQYPEFRRQLSFDDGTLVSFHSADKNWDKENQGFEPSAGLIIREDWLQQLGMEKPTTIDEWETVLRAFKNTDLNGNGQADEIPFGTSTEAFMGAYNMKDNFYVDPDTGKVQYYMVSPNFKDYITKMNQWYAEGLIDPEYLSTDSNLMDSKILNDRTGALYGYQTAHLGKYIGLKPELALSAVPYPQNSAGEVIYPYDYQMVSDVQTVITSDCANPEAAVKYLDYFYTEAGSTYMTYGIEGESYTVDENGEKQYTDIILNNPDGKSPGDALSVYTPALRGFPKYGDGEYSKKFVTMPQQLEAAEVWSQYDKIISLPTLTLTTEENNEYTRIMRDVDTYAEETISKLIMGLEPVSNLDQIQQQLKDMGIDRAIAIQQAAYDRYLSRQ